MQYVRGPLAKRFWAKVRRGKACWEWLGWKDADGYGSIWLRKKKNHHVYGRAPRICWELTKGRIPPGLQVLHRCDNPCCVRPSHLFLGTSEENHADSVAKGRQCKGTKQWEAKLDEKKVREIRSKYRRGINPIVRGGPNTYDLAKEFGVSQGLISQIIRRKVWNWL